MDITAFCMFRVFLQVLHSFLGHVIILRFFLSLKQFVCKYGENHYIKNILRVNFFMKIYFFHVHEPIGMPFLEKSENLKNVDYCILCYQGSAVLGDLV